ncbi:MAG: hypothetical protein DRN96_02090 [Thermoproteota archaeon]|nr:MAG: hypothetical protein DRN96_02090 [Candidatus Korarchaeota archaeon]
MTGEHMARLLILLALLAFMQEELPPVWTIELGSGVSCCSVSPGGEVIVAGTRLGYVYGVADGVVKWRVRLGKAVTCLDSAGDLALCGTADGILAIVSTESGEVLNRIRAGSYITAVSLSSSGEIAAAGTLDGRVLILERGEGRAGYTLKAIAKLEFAVKSVVALKRKPAVIAGGGMAVYALDLDGEVSWKLVLNDTLTCMSCSERAMIVAAGTLSGSLVIKSGKYVNKIQLGGMVLSVDVAEIGRIIASTSDGKVFILDSSGAELAEYKVIGGAAKVVVAAKSGGYVVAGLSNLAVASIGITGRLLWTYSGLMGEPTAIAISEDGRTVVVGSEDYHLYIWDFHGIEVSKVEVERCMEMLVNESYPMLVEIYNRNQYEMNVTLSVEGFSFMHADMIRLEPSAVTRVNLTFTPAKEGEGKITVRISAYGMTLSEKSIRGRASSLGAKVWIVEAPEHAVEGENATVIVKVLNAGVKRGEFEVEVAGELFKAAKRRLFIKEGASVEVAFNITFTKSGEGELEARVYYSGSVLAKASRSITVEPRESGEGPHTVIVFTEESTRGEQLENTTETKLVRSHVLAIVLAVSIILMTSLMVLFVSLRRRWRKEELLEVRKKPRPVFTVASSTEDIYKKILEEARRGESS